MLAQAEMMKHANKHLLNKLALACECIDGNISLADHIQVCENWDIWCYELGWRCCKSVLGTLKK